MRGDAPKVSVDQMTRDVTVTHKARLTIPAGVVAAALRGGRAEIEEDGRTTYLVRDEDMLIAIGDDEEGEESFRVRMPVCDLEAAIGAAPHSRGENRVVHREAWATSPEGVVAYVLERHERVSIYFDHLRGLHPPFTGKGAKYARMMSATWAALLDGGVNDLPQPFGSTLSARIQNGEVELTLIGKDADVILRAVLRRADLQTSHGGETASERV